MEVDNDKVLGATAIIKLAVDTIMRANPIFNRRTDFYTFARGKVKQSQPLIKGSSRSPVMSTSRTQTGPSISMAV
jgi:hypothetical protein